MSKKRIANYVFLPGVSSESNAYPDAYSLLQANKTFIIKESSAFISSRVISDNTENLNPHAVTLLTNNKQFILDEISAWTAYQTANAEIGTTFYGYVYTSTEISKCKRDMGYLIDALIYDIRYGGNERVSYIASQYYLSGVVQLINPTVEVAIQEQLWNLIINYVLPITLYPTQQSPVTTTQNVTGTSAESLAVTRATTLSTIASNVIAGGLSTLPSTVYSEFAFAGYTYDTGKCERDVGYILDAYLNDLRYGGNFKTRLISSRYWDGERPQIVGDRQQEIVTHQFIRDLINHTIFFGSLNTAKCERDIGYLIDGVKYDVALGTNYNQIFLGLAEYNSLDVTDTVVAAIQTAKSLVASLPDVASSVTATSRANGFFSEVLDIAQNGRSAANALSFPNPDTASDSQIAAKNKLVANRDFLAAEVNAWVALTYPAADHDVSKCTRDLHYAIDAMCYDIVYNCNQATYDQAKFFFYSFADGSSGINASHKTVTVAAYTYFKSIVDNIVLGQSITPTTTGTNPNLLTQVISGNNALPGEAIICQNLAQITISVINAGTQSAANTYLAGVTKTYPNVAWADSALQDAKTAIENSKTSIVNASADYTPLQQSYPRQLLNGLAAEAGADTRITDLSLLVTSVIKDGLSSLPTLVNGVSTIKLQGRYTLGELLLITNSTNNQFLYNFSDPQLGAIITFDGPYDTNNHYRDLDFPQFLQIADYVTTIILKADTSTSSSSDDIQIFVEGEEQKVRPYDFGTDAIERMRVAQPQSMLDADFEYGLQPTKWQAIGIARGYPSVYEVPGSDTAVLTVVTDASEGTGGIGESLITVTTASAHGFVVGTPITIRSLANTVSGFNRAEGTFIIIGVPSPTTFNYYAAAKVGTSNGQILATTYTQLRKGAFYTGASIGQPTLSVYSNGQVSSFTTKFITPSNSQQIAVAGALPQLGSPLISASLISGTQVTGTVGPGGLAATVNVGNPAEIGDTFVTVADSSSILEGLAIDNGTGTAVFVNSIIGNTINLTGPLTAPKSGNIQTYLNLPGTNITPTGTGADFSIERTFGAYSNPQVTTGGIDYVLNSRIKILGSDLEGADVINDAVLKITSIIDGRISTFTSAGDSLLITPVVAQGFSTTSGNGTGATFDISDDGTAGAIDTLSSTGTPLLPMTPVTGVSQSSTTGSGSGATFDISDDGTAGGFITFTTAGTPNAPVAPLSNVSQSTTTGLGIGATFNITDDGTAGGLTTFTTAGTPNAPMTPLTGVAQSSTSGGGQGATFDISDDGAGNYIVTLADAGHGYQLSNTITILGSVLGGSDGVNDLTITVSTVTAGDYSVTLVNPGTGYAPTDTVTILGSVLGGIDITNDLTITVSTVTEGAYSVTLVNPGSAYLPTDTITILGSVLGGTDVTNDLTITVSTVLTGSYIVAIADSGNNFAVSDTITILGSVLDGVDTVNDLVITVTAVDNGIIDAVSIISGSSVSGERSYTELLQNTTTGIGSNATFNVQTSGGVYIATLVNPGSAYVLGEALTISGSQLGGSNGVNDLVITVTTSSAPAGGIISFNTSGLPSTVDAIFTSLTGEKITPGVNATFDITRSVGSYQDLNVNVGGANYEPNDQILIDGSDLGGVSPDNDAIVTVTAVDVSGAISEALVSGTATTGGTIAFWSAISISEVTSSSIANATTISTAAIATIQVEWATPHGLVPGMSLLVDITSSGTNHAYAKGPFFVESVPSLTTIRYTARTSGVVDTTSALTGIVYARPESFFIHRPFDGGVQLGTGGPQHGSQAIRMSKKYIRYQSGKGVMYTTGALFAPSYNLQSATATGTTVGSYITFTTDDVDHGCQVGGRVKIIGIDTAGYNGTYDIVSIQSERVFTVQATANLGGQIGSITASAQMSILNWHGATVRAGTFDDQNGMFWQYDGRELSVGRRSSTLQLSGVSSIEKDTNLVTGVNTRYRDQIKAGDKIVIKGMTHVVTNVQSQTQLTVTPDYRGANNCVSSKVCLVQEILIPQSQFNLDKLDGTGPSGYNVDITKMQMIGMQWSWYGAGFIDFMLRGSDGNYIFCHRIRNSNVNTEAYMRTGNMPVRYEVYNEGALGKLNASMTATQTTIPLVDATSFPDESGHVYIDNEIISFTGKSGNSLTGCTRAAPMAQFSGGSTRLFSAGSATTHEVNTGVVLISNTITPIISHWGSAFLTDGNFDEDRGYIFNYASTGIQASTTKQTAFLIRLAPSVSNAIVGDLGDRELINRAQLLLQEIAVSSDTGTGGLVIEGILNPQNYPIDPTAITWSALNSSAAGGQPSFAQIAPGGSVSWAGGATTTTSTATTTAALTGTASVPNNAVFTSPSGSNLIYVSKSSWDSLGASAGFSVDASETRFPNGTTISSVTENPSPVATTISLLTGTATIPPSAFFKTTANTNVRYFTQASWNALNGQLGSTTYGSDFPAGTIVSNIAGPAVAAGQSYYTVTFSQNSLVPHNPVQSSLSTYYIVSQANTATIYFSSAQTYAPYSVGDSITLTGNPSITGINNTYSVKACTTSYVQVTSGINFNNYSSGTVVNNNVRSTIAFSVTGQATSGSSSLNFTQASWAGLPKGSAVINNTVNDTSKFNAGTTISSISALKTFNGVNYYTVTFNSALLVSLPADTAVTFNYVPYYTVALSKNSTSSVDYNTTVPFTPAILSTNTSFLYFTKTSWESLVNSYGAGAGTLVVDTEKFPSGTSIQSVGALSSFGGTQYYRINFTQSSITPIGTGTDVTFQFGQPPYALPGETVFSFIAAPGSTNSLALDSLKELTNTTLGGRGTYPNGPDVLAINVYKTSGTPIPTNVVIRWGEAQA